MGSNDTTGTMKHNKQNLETKPLLKIKTTMNYDSKVQKTQNTESKNQNHDTQEVLIFFLRHKNYFSYSSSLCITVIVAVTKEQLKYTEWPPGDAVAPTPSPNPLQFLFSHPHHDGVLVNLFFIFLFFCQA